MRIGEDFNIKCKLSFTEAIELLNKKENTKHTVYELPEEGNIELWKPINRDGVSEVVIIEGYDAQLHLAYKVNLSSDNEFGNYLAYIDAESGILVYKSPCVMLDSPGSGETRYSEDVNISTTYSSGIYKLFETNRLSTNTDIITKNYHEQTADNTAELTTGRENAYDFTDNNNDWTYNDLGYDLQAIDVHWGLETTFDYFENVLDYTSYDNLGSTIEAFVHVRSKDNDSIPQRMDNAFYQGEVVAFCFGDGDPYTNSSSWTTLDIVAHEFGHAVTHHTSELEYGCESGALNESFSDIWAACVEDWATLDPEDDDKETFLCAEENDDGPIRSMGNPNDYEQPDTYESQTYWYDLSECNPSKYNDWCGVHTNSGVGNFWFYLLVNGGTGVNDFNQSYYVDGIGITQAAEIVLEMGGYLSPTSDFASARQASICAAVEITEDENSCEVRSVMNAWHAVHVGDSYFDGVVVSGPDLVCSSSAYSISNLPAGYSITWNCSENITQVSDPGSNPCYFSADTDNEDGFIGATITSNCNDSYELLDKEVWLGKPELLSISGPNPPPVYKGCIGQPYTFWANPAREPNSESTYQWMVVGGDFDFQYIYQDWATVIFYDETDYYYVMARAYNTCGYTQWWDKNMQIMNCGYFMMYPNPATDVVTVDFIGPSEDISNIEKPSDFTVQILDYSGILYYSANKSGDSFTIPVSNLKGGSYTVRITYGKEVENLPLIIKH